MKKYKIEFTADYLQYEEWAKDGDSYWKQQVKDNPEKLECAVNGKTKKSPFWNWKN